MRGRRRSRGRTRRLIRALARAHRSKQMLEDGPLPLSAGEIAKAEGLSRSFVSRLLRLTLLAPDIIKAPRVAAQFSGFRDIAETKRSAPIRTQIVAGAGRSGFGDQTEVIALTPHLG
jgi:hypothetical protein